MIIKIFEDIGFKTGKKYKAMDIEICEGVSKRVFLSDAEFTLARMNLPLDDNGVMII